jgi:hypothetical protein
LGFRSIFRHADLVRIVHHAGVEELHFITLADGAVHYAEIRDDATEGIEYAVENERLQRCCGIAFRRWHALNNGFQQLVHAQAGFAAGTEDVLQLAADEVHDLVLHLLRVGAGQVHLVQHGNDLQVVLQGQVEVADGLRLNALGGVHDQ